MRTSIINDELDDLREDECNSQKASLNSLIIIIYFKYMPQIKIYHIITSITKTSVMSGDYESCLTYFKQQDKLFRKTHKIISAEEYNKIIKKKPIL